MEAGSSTTPPRMDATTSLIGIRAPHGQQINGKVISQGTTGFIGHNCGIRCSRVRKPHLYGQIWHKAVVINEWRARIAPVSISKRCVFCLPNTSESVKHKFWDCIQARRAWRWATYIMHECQPQIPTLMHCSPGETLWLTCTYSPHLALRVGLNTPLT